jgi:hypothetical protein
VPPGAVEEVLGADEVVEELGPVEPPLVKVELMGPTLMSEKMTLALGYLASTVAGSLPVVGQVPRLLPGVVEPVG